MSEVQLLSERLDPARIEALHAVLGVERDSPVPFAHQVFFWDARGADQLGRDGHPIPGLGIVPETGLPRRMWAGGTLTFGAALNPGEMAEKKSTVLSVDKKSGKRGPLVVVKIVHQVSQAGVVSVEDEQVLVYLKDRTGPDQSEQPKAPTDEEREVTRRFTTTELFRYSALTHNGHRIHYDRDYARDVEFYPGLVVHGPLLAQHLMLLAEAELGSLREFRFRATAPLFDFEEAVFCLKASDIGLSLWVRGPDGRLCMTAEAA